MESSPSKLKRWSVFTSTFLEGLFGDSSRRVQLLTYLGLKNGPPVSGKVVLFD